MSPLTFGQQNFVVSVALSSYGRCERLGLCLRGRVQVRAIGRGVARDAAHHELLELDALTGNVRVSFVPVNPRFHAPHSSGERSCGRARTDEPSHPRSCEAVARFKRPGHRHGNDVRAA